MNQSARALILAGLCASCAQPDRLADSPPVDPRTYSPVTSLEPVALHPVIIRDNAGWDAWERRVSDRRGELYAFRTLASLLGEQSGGPMALVRTVALFYRAEQVSQGRAGPVSQLSRLEEGLKKNDPELAARLAPDIRFTVGYAAWRMAQGRANEPEIPMDGGRRGMIDTITKNWGAIVRDYPDWKGPFGIDATVLAARLEALEAGLERTRPSRPPKTVRPANTSGWVSERLDAFYASQKRPPAREGRLPAFYRHLVGFMDTYEAEGHKKACPMIDAALSELNDPVRLGGAYAHCALDRDNPYAAIDHLRRLTSVHQPAGIPAILVRLRVKAAGDAALGAAIDALETELRAAAAADVGWGERTGLASWFRPETR